MLSIKDMVYSLFGAYASTGTIRTTDAKAFLNNYVNNVSIAGASSSLSRNSIFSKVGQKQLKVYRSTFDTRSGIFEAIDAVKYLDISQQIIETVVNDAFNSFDAEEPFTVEYTGTAYNANEINAIIAKTVKRLKLYSVFRDIADDFITYGEYYLETPCSKGVGIIELNDTVSTKKVVSVYDSSELLYHVAERKTNHGTEIVQIEKDALTHFVLDVKRINVKSGKFDKVEGIPEIMKMGRSILLPVLGLLQRYHLIDLANTANDLKQALMPAMISVGINDSMTPEQVLELTRRYEEYFMEASESLQSLDSSKGDLDANHLMNLATQVKIIPTGEGRGALQRQSFSSEVNLNESQDRLVSRIKSTIGIPLDEESKSRLDNLREKSRYAKKLLDIQFGAAHSLVEGIILKDLRYQGIIVDASNISLKFKAVQNPNAVEDAEDMFHLATSARDTIRTYIEMAEDIPGLRVSPKQAKAFIDDVMSRFPHLENMLEEVPEEMDVPSGDTDFDTEPENAGFIDKSDGDIVGPETLGAEPGEDLIDEEPEEFEEPEPEIEMEPGEE